MQLNCHPRRVRANGAREGRGPRAARSEQAALGSLPLALLSQCSAGNDSEADWLNDV
jgi:hypothetical protein